MKNSYKIVCVLISTFLSKEILNRVLSYSSYEIFSNNTDLKINWDTWDILLFVAIVYFVYPIVVFIIAAIIPNSIKFDIDFFYKKTIQGFFSLCFLVISLILLNKTFTEEIYSLKNTIDSQLVSLEEKEKLISNLNSKLEDPYEIFELYKEYRLMYLKKNNYSGQLSIKHYNNNNFLSGQFIDGEKNGIWKEYYSNGQLKYKGEYFNNDERGIWTYYNYDGSKDKSYKYEYVRVGASCCDGTTSNATGSGACSWHGGVCSWINDYVRYKY